MIGSVTEKLSFSLDELVRETSLSNSFLRNEIRAGRLKAKKFGDRTIILLEDWLSYAETKENWKPGVCQINENRKEK